jgi:hypothetical protein
MHSAGTKSEQHHHKHSSEPCNVLAHNHWQARPDSTLNHAGPSLRSKPGTACTSACDWPLVEAITNKPVVPAAMRTRHRTAGADVCCWPLLEAIHKRICRSDLPTHCRNCAAVSEAKCQQVGSMQPPVHAHTYFQGSAPLLAVPAHWAAPQPLLSSNQCVNRCWYRRMPHTPCCGLTAVLCAPNAASCSHFAHMLCHQLGISCGKL